MKLRKPAKNLTERLIAMACQDLEASAVLYEKKHYPQAVFLLQQAVEKSTKSFGLYFSIIAESDVKGNIGHLSVKIFEKSMKKFNKSVINIKEASEEVPRLGHIIAILGNLDPAIAEIDTTKQLEILRECSKNPKRYRDLSLEYLEDILNDIKEVEEDVDIMKKVAMLNVEIPDDITSHIINEYVDLMYLLSTSPNHKLEVEKAKEDLYSLFADKGSLQIFAVILNELNSVSIYLLSLSIILQPHAIAARYPDNGFNPIKFYTPNRPLIQKLPDLIEITKRAVKRLNNTMSRIALKDQPS